MTLSGHFYTLRSIKFQSHTERSSSVHSRVQLCYPSLPRTPSPSSEHITVGSPPHWPGTCTFKNRPLFHQRRLSNCFHGDATSKTEPADCGNNSYREKETPCGWVLLCHPNNCLRLKKSNCQEGVAWLGGVAVCSGSLHGLGLNPDHHGTGGMGQGRGSVG